MNRYFISFLFLISLSSGWLQAAVPAGADTIEVVGKYVMGDRDSRLDARQYALLDAKRKALEHFGTYLTSSTTVQNYQLTSDEINTYAAGFLKTDVLEEWTETQGDFTTMYVKIRAVIDPRDVEKGLNEIKQQAGEEASFSEMTASFRAILAETENPEKGKRPLAEPPVPRSWKEQKKFELWMKLSVEAGRKQPDLRKIQRLIAEWEKYFSDSEIVQGHLGIALFKHHQVDKAIPLLETSSRALSQQIRASKLPPGSPHLRLMTWQLAFYHSYLAKCYRSKGDHHQAHRHETIRHNLMKHLGKREFHRPR